MSAYCSDCFNQIMAGLATSVDRAVVYLKGRGYCLEHYLDIFASLGGSKNNIEEKRQALIAALYQCELGYATGEHKPIEIKPWPK